MAKSRNDLVSVDISDFRRLLRRNPKSKIAKIVVSHRDWDALLQLLRDEISRVPAPKDTIVVIESPLGCELSLEQVVGLLALLTPSNVTWGTADSETDHYRVKVWAC